MYVVSCFIISDMGRRTRFFSCSVNFAGSMLRPTSIAIPLIKGPKSILIYISFHKKQIKRNYSNMIQTQYLRGTLKNIITHQKYIQVDFGEPISIMAVVTMGLADTALVEFVKKYMVKYSNTASTWSPVLHGTTNVSLCLKL